MTYVCSIKCINSRVVTDSVYRQDGFQNEVDNFLTRPLCVSKTPLLVTPRIPIQECHKTYIPGWSWILSARRSQGALKFDIMHKERKVAGSRTTRDLLGVSGHCLCENTLIFSERQLSAISVAIFRNLNRPDSRSKLQKYIACLLTRYLDPASDKDIHTFWQGKVTWPKETSISRFFQAFCALRNHPECTAPAWANQEKKLRATKWMYPE